MAVEKIRGCGFRKVGGLYLCGEGASLACDRLPFELVTCPTCGAGVKFSRGFQWLDWLKYAGIHASPDSPCACPGVCPVCEPVLKPQPYGLLWVGESFYTPQSFIEEALDMGVSRRIAAVPRKLKLGETWVLFAHIKAVQKLPMEFDVEEFSDEELGEYNGRITAVGNIEYAPGIFYAFRPRRIEKLIWKSDAKPEYLEELEKAGITPIIIPDGDVDHNPKTPLKLTDADRAKAESEQLLGDLASMRMKLSQSHIEEWDPEEEE